MPKNKEKEVEKTDKIISPARSEEVVISPMNIDLFSQVWRIIFELEDVKEENINLANAIVELQKNLESQRKVINQLVRISNKTMPLSTGIAIKLYGWKEKFFHRKDN